MRIRLLAAVAVGALMAPVALAAHHGAAVYDNEKTVTVTGTVTRFDFVNPHVLIFAEVEQDDGTKVVWSGELTSPNRLARSEQEGAVRWHRNLLQPGDQITLVGNPALNGAPSLNLRRVIDGSGRALIGGNN